MLSDKVTEAFKKLPTSVKVGLGIVPILLTMSANADAVTKKFVISHDNGGFHTEHISSEEVVPEQSYRYGKALKEAGKYDDARFEFRKVYRLHPTSPVADDAMGEYLDMYLERHADPKSEFWGNMWMKLTSKYPDSPYIDQLEDTIEDLKDRREQILERERREAQKLSPEEMLEKAHKLYDNEEFKQARDIYLKCVEADVVDWQTYGNLLGTYFGADIPYDKKIVNAVEEGIKDYPKDEYFYKDLLMKLKREKTGN